MLDNAFNNTVDKRLTQLPHLRNLQGPTCPPNLTQELGPPLEMFVVPSVLQDPQGQGL